MQDAKITRAALGRFAKLGALYDARCDKFVGVNALKNTDADIWEKDASKVEIDLIVTDSIEEKTNKLSINGELSLSILAGLVNVSGSASFLRDQERSFKSERMTMVYSVFTKHQELDGIKRSIDTDLLKSTDATHIVVAIDWGAKCSITCEYVKSSNEDEKTVQGKLQAEIGKFKKLVSVKGEAATGFTKQQEEKEGKFSFHSRCDVSDLNNDIPSNFKDAVTIATKLPSVVRSINDGKGIPITFTMISLNQVRKMCEIEQEVDVVWKRLQDSAIKRCFQTMERFNDLRKKVYDLIKDLKEYKDFVRIEYLTKANALQQEFEITESNFKSKLAEILIQVRSGNQEISAIEDLLNEFIPDNDNIDLIEIGSVYNKIKLIDTLRSRNVRCIGPNSAYDLALHLSRDKKVYILYMCFSYTKKKPDIWRKQIELFFRLMSSHQGEMEYKFIMKDTETDDSGMRIEYFDKGELCCADVLAEEAQDLQYPMIKMDKVEFLRTKPNRRVNCEIMCPKSFSGGCPTETLKWCCYKCKQIIEYGVDDQYFYCKCGGGKYSGAVFRCTDIKHGLSFVSYDNSLFKKVLSDLRMVKETNIIILGETGVGKSTWINALANYLEFPTLEEARCNDVMKTIIPSHFSYTSETGEMKEIFVGDESSNEILNPGESATQEPKAYKFYIGKHVIRLIDTPGIGDVRGLEQDEKNFENILAHISYYDEIHGICILLKPNDSRLTVTFRFCIIELLTHLHKAAAENIIFCFTNARSTFYRPGDTLPMLKKLIANYKDAVVNVTPQNQFCFDNEAFRFLACLHNGVQFSREDINTYSSSWDRAVSETNRLFQHILNLKPHPVQHTVSLNNARRIILELSKPLATISGIIQDNIDAAARKSDELKKSNKTAEELQSQLYFDVLDLETVHLEFPRTVCTDSKCIDYVQQVLPNLSISDSFLSEEYTK